MKARSYVGLHDLQAMLDLLSEGAAANTGTHYVHRGDLQWWLFYTDTPEEVWRSNIRLWHEGERLVGWCLLSPEENACDVYTAPELRGDPREHEMLAWAVAQFPELDHLDMHWVDEDDNARIRWLEAHGFARRDFHLVYFRRLLTDPLPAPQLPAGFTLRTSCGTPEDAQIRALTSGAAFETSKPFEEYWPRAYRLMCSPVYVPEHELFLMAPDGRVASYCIVWTDTLTKVGHFEPVGTHPDFQRQGLGKSLLFDALRRLQSEGMTAADVCTNYDNPAAIRLYESVGFRIQKRLFVYRKQRTP